MPLSNCDVPVLEPFGRFNTAYNLSSSLRTALNSSGDFLGNVDGTNRTYSSLENLSGEYYPAKDYQPDNTITLSSPGTISTDAISSLTIRSGADFVFESGKEVVLRAGFQVRPGGTFTAKVDPSLTNSRIDALHKPSNERESIVNAFQKIELPANKKFDASKYIEIFKGSINDNSYLRITPNPTNGIITIELVLESEQKEISISVKNGQGQLVLARPEYSFKNGSIQLDLENQPSGIYLILIEAGSKHFKEKVIKI